MTAAEIALGIGLVAVVGGSAIALTALVAARKSVQQENERLSKELVARDVAAEEHREEISRFREQQSELNSRLTECSDRNSRLQGEVAAAEAKAATLADNLTRYSTIGDAEEYATRVKGEAENRVAELNRTAATIKTNAISIRDQGRQLKTQRDALIQQIKSLELYRQGHTTVEQLEAERASRKAVAEQEEREARENHEKRRHELSVELRKVVDELERRKTELDLIDDVADMQSHGLYEPTFDFDHSDEYKAALKECVATQKQMVREKEACFCSTTWTVEGSEAKGRTMINRNIKLMLRAINGECDAIISKVKYNNVESSETRIKKCFDIINKLGETNQIAFSPAYQQLKLNELYLNYEHAANKQEEKEREREIREAMREEERAQKEIEKAQKQAEDEERTKEDALTKARAELSSQHGQHNEKLEQLVKKLEDELSEAIDRKAKAIARAQLTRSGHVYILSNIGTMGAGVFKIGMTRRLEPLERVKELGDASVPFPFDFHALIYSEDAPALESALHQRFNDRRVNLVNMRKEYFRVTLDEVREAVGELYGEVTFRLDPEAEQYHTTVAMEGKAVPASMA